LVIEFVLRYPAGRQDLLVCQE